MKLFQTDRYNFSLTLLRLALGIVIFMHGAQKVLGWWGGLGWSGTMNMFQTQLGIPPFLAACAIVAEFFGALGLIMGFLTRIAAFGILVDLVVAVFIAHAPGSPFMAWFGGQGSVGLEYHVLAVAMAWVLVARGAGALSIDSALGSDVVDRADRHHHLRAA